MEIYVTETGKTAVAMVTDRAYFLPSVAAARSVVRHQNEPHDIFLFCHNFEPTRDEQSWLNVNIPQLTCVSIDLIDIFKLKKKDFEKKSKNCSKLLKRYYWNNLINKYLRQYKKLYNESSTSSL